MTLSALRDSWGRCVSSPGEGRSTSISRLKWGDTGTHGLVGGEQRGFADATFLCTPPRSAPIVAWWAFAVERVNQKALAFYSLSDNIFVACLVTTRCTSRELCL